MKQSSLVLYERGSMTGLALFKNWIIHSVPVDYGAQERQEVLSDASLVFEAMLLVSARQSFYESLLSGTSALLDRYGEKIGERDREARLKYAVKCCEAAKKRLFGKLCQEMRRVPGRIASRQRLREKGLNPDAIEAVCITNWRFAGISKYEKTGICMREEDLVPPFMNPYSSRDKTCLIPPNRWYGDDGCYEPTGD